MMTHSEIEKALVDWFSNHRGPSLELPDGYFGRPLDNAHDLTFVVSRPHKLIVELDEQILLIFTDCQTASAGKCEFTLSDFRQLTFDWQGYGDMTPHVTTYSSGSVRFRVPV